MFLENFLAEAGLDIALACTTFAFLYKGGRKWKILSVAFFIAISPFYLTQNPDFPFFQFNDSTLILVWLFLMPIGAFILVNNLKIYSYHLVVNKPKTSIKSKTKSKPKTKKSVHAELKKIEQITLFLLATIIITLLSFSLHESLEILQFPLQLVGVICVIYLGISYYQNYEKNRSLNQRISVILRTFLFSFYVIMFYTFTYFMLYLQTFLSINLYFSMIVSTLVIGVIFLLIEKPLLALKEAILCSSQKRSLGEIFAKYFNKNALFSLLLTLGFSDSLLGYTILLEENVENLILWMLIFVVFICGVYIKHVKNNLEFKMQIGLLKQAEIEKEYNKLIGKEE